MSHGKKVVSISAAVGSLWGVRVHRIIQRMCVRERMVYDGEGWDMEGHPAEVAQTRSSRTRRAMTLRWSR